MFLRQKSQKLTSSTLLIMTAIRSRNSSKLMTPSLFSSNSFMISRSSCLVGFWPKALITTPISLMSMMPFLSLSKMLNTSLNPKTAFYFTGRRIFSKKFTNAKGYHAKEHEKMYQKAIALRFKMLICVWCQSCPCLNSSTWSSVNPKKFSDMMETSFLFKLKVEDLYFH